MYCVQCGQNFEPSAHNQKYCGKSCQKQAFAPQKRTYKRHCPECGGMFETDSTRKLFCTPPCLWSWRNRKRPTTQDKDRACIVCGSIFKPMQKRGVGKQTCSDECRKIHRRQLKERYLRKQETVWPSSVAVSDRVANGNPGRKALSVTKYGITMEQYNIMHAEQEGRCWICKRSETATDNRTGKAKMLAVDHKHDSNHVRGLLCLRCNTALGRFRDDPENLRRAIEFLALPSRFSY